MKFRTHLKRWLIRGLVVGAIVYWGIPLLFPLPDKLLEPPSPSSAIFDGEGVLLRRPLNADDLRFGHWVAFEDIPPALVNATLAAEDKRFWRHGGVDIFAISRSFRDAADDGRFSSGASTITQQLIKITSPEAPRAVSSKLREMVLARKIEVLWSKKRILTEYLNRLDYGNFRQGCASAAEGFFGKPLKDMSTAECALIAGLPQAPARHNPYKNFASAKKRQEWILMRMTIDGTLPNEVLDRHQAEPVKIAPIASPFLAPHFADLVLSQLSAPVERVDTTLDQALEQSIEAIVHTNIQRLRTYNVTNASVIVIHNPTGELRAMVGSQDYFENEAGQVNGALAARSAGSTLKPFTYLLGLEKGMTPASIIADLPVEYMTEDGIYTPVNYSRRFYGPMPVRKALANSLNVSAVKALREIGGPQILMDSLASLGITTLTEPPEHYGLGLTIGNGEVNLLELSNAFACIARLGEWKPLLMQPAPPADSKRIYDARCSWLIADILSDNLARARSFGLHSSLRMPFRVASKTGTSTDFRDNWTLGFTPEFTVGVWVGNFDGSPMQNVSGVSGAGSIFHETFVEIKNRFGTSWYPELDGIIELPIDPVLGKRQLKGTEREKFVEDNLPDFVAPEDYDDKKRRILPENYRHWITSDDNWLGDSVTVSQNRSVGLSVDILSPLPGSTYFLDPDLPNGGAQLPLETSGRESITWSSETLHIEGTIAYLLPGKHQLTARDPRSGLAAHTWLVVKQL